MALDGKVLARARDALEEIKHNNETELNRRRAEVYAKLPEVKATELSLRSLMVKVIGTAIKKGEDAGAAVERIAQESMALQDKLARLLEDNGYPGDYLDDIYSCKKCRDTGFIGGKPCSCLMKLYNAERARDLSSLLRLGEERFENFDLKYYSDVPYNGVGQSERSWMQAVLRYCKSYALGFNRDSDNLLFQGATGLGKTFLSACIARVVAGKGFSVVYETVVGAVEPLEKQKFGRSEEYENSSDGVRRVLECDLLILDDLGTEMYTAFTASALYTIINTRLMTGRKTIISTNLSDEEISRRYMPQLVSRLEGEFEKLQFVGQDIRLQKRQQM